MNPGETTVFPLMRPVVAGPNHMNEPSIGQTFGPIIDAYRNAPRLKPVDLNDDPSVLGRIKHVLKPKEKLLEFYARTGLGKSQLMTMSRDEIKCFVAQAEANRKQEPLPPPEAYEPRRIPARMMLIDTDSL
jgi:hypothetical protein